MTRRVLQYFTIKKIEDIDGSPDARKYINILRTQHSGSGLPFQVKKYLTDSQLYNQQTHPNAKALLLLNTLPFNTFDKAIKDSILKEEFNYGKIIKLPTLYLYWIGGTLWRYNESADPINWGTDNITKQFTYPTNKYLYTIGDPAAKAYPEADSEIGDSLKKLPKQVKESLINYFKVWVKNTQDKGWVSLF